MRKFVEPEMKVMAVNMKENIAHSHVDPEHLGNKNNGAYYCKHKDGRFVDTNYTSISGSKPATNLEGDYPGLKDCRADNFSH